MEIKEIYKLRGNFSIIGLTGKTGSGCTKLSEIISENIDFENTIMLRKPDEIAYSTQDESESIEKIAPNEITLFKSKYKICYDLISKNCTPYKRISYIDVMLFMYCITS